MPRLINLADHKNLWGATTSKGLEPQRSDLWLVDLTELVNGLNKQGIFQKLGLAAVPVFYPQFVQSVTFPELKMKPEVYRRDSVPFNMPSWDEPLDPVKIVFLMDTDDNPNQSRVTSVLQAWQAIVRAGRGDRSSLYADDAVLINLNSSYRYDYTFPIRIAMLRGSFTTRSSLNAEQITQMNQQMENQASFQADFMDSIQSVFAGAAPGDFETASALTSLATGRNVFSSSEVTQRPLAQQPWLEVAANWRLQNAWLGGWKMSDLAYADSKLVTVDATIYAEDLYETAK